MCQNTYIVLSYHKLNWVAFQLAIINNLKLQLLSHTYEDPAVVPIHFKYIPLAVILSGNF